MIIKLIWFIKVFEYLTKKMNMKSYWSLAFYFFSFSTFFLVIHCSDWFDFDDFSISYGGSSLSEGKSTESLHLFKLFHTNGPIHFNNDDSPLIWSEEGNRFDFIFLSYRGGLNLVNDSLYFSFDSADLNLFNTGVEMHHALVSARNEFLSFW